jgi:hypothetical protein
LVKEWGETSKEEVVCGSTATLTVLSPGDRTYLGLYTVEAGAVRMDVYRDGTLYWSGTLDTEFYEEPYATLKDYEVTLTFADFGILERLTYAGTGIENCRTLVMRIIEAASFGYMELWELCATSITADGATGLAQLSVRADNFYDEEGDASTLKEVLEGVLQPLGLRVVQWAGKVYLYDLESAYRELPSTPVCWMSDDQMLGVDKVVNNVEVELSTYAEAELLTGDMDYPGTVTEGSTVVGSTETPSLQPVWSYYADLTCTGNVQFTLYTTSDWDFATKPGLAQVGDGDSDHSQPKWCHIDPLYGGEETDCVAAYWRTGISKESSEWMGHGIEVNPYSTTNVTVEDRDSGREDSGKTETSVTTSYDEGSLIYRSYQSYLQQVSDPDRYLLRVKIEMRLDTHYNPFGSGEDNCKTESDLAEEYVNTIRMRGRILLKDMAGNVLMHVDNSGMSGCVWVDGDDEDKSMVLEWYDLSDQSNAAVNSWMTNCYHGIPRSSGIKHVETEASGTLIPYPPQPGYVEIELWSGVWLGHYIPSRDSTGSSVRSYEDIWGKNGIVREIFWWHLVKAPVLTIVNNDTKATDVDTDDVTYRGVLNAAAKEDLELNTICGTLDPENATARAVFMNAETGAPLKSMTRAGRTTTVEQLLIGTLYSQFADRKLMLTGTAALDGAPLGLRTEYSAEGIAFLTTGEVQDLQADTTELTMVELRPDEYTSNED